MELGTKVVVTRDGPYFARWGTVRAVSGSDRTLIVKFDSGLITGWISFDDVQVVTEGKTCSQST